MSEVFDRFRLAAETLCNLLKEEGMWVRPYNHARLAYFQLLSDEEQEQSLNLLENYCALCQQVQKAGQSLRDHKVFVQKALEFFKLQLDPRALEYSEPNVVFEFYSLNQTQFFRTTNFFEFTSYTIEDLYARSWMSLYGRDEKVMEGLMKCAQEVAQGRLNLAEPGLPPHALSERASLERIKVKVEMLVVGALKKGEQVAGLLSVVRCGEFMDNSPQVIS